MKEQKNGQVYWFIGLSGSGKSTLSNKLYEYMKGYNLKVKLIDGDELRSFIGGNIGYSIAERKKIMNIIIYLVKNLSECGISVIVANIGAFENLRKKARREIVNYNEFYIKCSIEECARRDVKGYYKKALSGELKNFIGVDQKFEEPLNSDLIINTDKYNLDESYELIIKYINKES